MNFLAYKNEIDSVVPGLTKAFQDLRSPDGIGLRTSTGRFYNNTFFGRDAGMSAKFVSDFDHEVSQETIKSLASLQGVAYNSRTQEQPGRIHHELRDLRTWQGSTNERMIMSIAAKLWGAKDKRILTYYSHDTTATFIRLVHKYALHIDQSILAQVIVDKSNEKRTIASSVSAAADWITQQVDDDNYFVPSRTNRSSLPYQTFQDGITAYGFKNRKLLHSDQSHCFVETQAYAVDALHDAIELLPGHERVKQWQTTLDNLQDGLTGTFWDDSQRTFNPAMQKVGNRVRMLDTPNVSAGWTLNAGFWNSLTHHERVDKVSGIVEQLFSDKFLTEYGLRTKARGYDTLQNVTEYHGSATVWPMFTFMVIEGLRRHRLYLLAEQLENRLINAAHQFPSFDEFYIVGDQNEIYRHDMSASDRLSVQMLPEHNIAFTVVPLMTIVYRRIAQQSRLEQHQWHKDLEQDIMARIPHVSLHSSAQEMNEIDVRSVKMVRGGAAYASVQKYLFGRMK